MRLLSLALTVCLLPLGGLAAADETRTEPTYDRIHIFGLRYSLLLGGTAFSAQDRDARAAFGRTHVLPDVRLWPFGAKAGPHFAWDASVRNMPGDQGQARFATANVGLRWQFAGPPASVVPYVVLRGGPYFARTGPGGYRTVGGGNAEMGVAVAHRLVFAGRYDKLGNVNGFDLSGYSVRLDFKVF